MNPWKRLIGGGDASIARARRPEALAASLGSAPLEGLAWLGRRPSPAAPLLYRLLLRLGEGFLFGACRIRVEVTGREHLPHGGYILVAALHRSWIDPLVVLRAVPIEPRVWFLGSGPTAFDRPWKERLLRRTGGILPVWRGGASVEVHVEAAKAVVEEGGILGLFMEGRIGGPPDRLVRAQHGAAVLALRTVEPIVPVVVCGTEELYRGKRISVRVLPPTSVAALLGTDHSDCVAPGTRRELQVAHHLTDALVQRMAPVVSADHPGTVDPAERRRRWSWLTRLMR
jgi:1-acyl-sn-glycerol-3-phosphate acyltransferase